MTRSLGVVAAVLACSLGLGVQFSASGGETRDDTACVVLADNRLEEPVRAIVAEYGRLTGTPIRVELLPVAQVNAAVASGKSECDVVLCMSDKEEETTVAGLTGASKVAWKYPTGEPVWAATLGGHPHANRLVGFFGSSQGHRLWSESVAGFTITSGASHAEAFDWVAENRVKHTYPATAARMLRECGSPDRGICIDVGCGTGKLDVELAGRSRLTIIGLDVDPDMQPLFEAAVVRAGLEDRVTFVVGDAQKMPFEDDYADLIVSRGTLVFIPDIGKCLREVERVLKPTGVAFLGGRYLYTPQMHKKTNEELKQIVRRSGVAGAEVIDDRGQWVKIVGPDAPPSAREDKEGPHLLVDRFVIDYGITEGDCLLICASDGPMVQSLQQGFLGVTGLKMTALYKSEEIAAEARLRVGQAKQQDRITCTVGDIAALPFEQASFDLVAGLGPLLIWGDRQKAMRELHRVLRPGGAALVGGRFLHMPESRKVSSEDLRTDAAKTGIASIRVVDDLGQWVEVRKGVRQNASRD